MTIIEKTEEQLKEWDKKIQSVLIKWEAEYFEGYKVIEYTLRNGKVSIKVNTNK